MLRVALSCFCWLLLQIRRSVGAKFQAIEKNRYKKLKLKADCFKSLRYNRGRRERLCRR